MTGNPELIAQYRRIHATRVYGHTSVKNLRFLRAEIVLRHPGSILDYGCGQSRLLDVLNLGYPAEFLRYDPAIAMWAERPNRVVDLLISIDVLEHVEECDLDAVMADMARLCRDAILVVDTRLASSTLPDGRNAHATIRPHAWWRERLSRHFPELHPLVTARRSRAAFKTWPRGGGQIGKYLALRTADTARFCTGWLLAKLGNR